MFSFFKSRRKSEQYEMIDQNVLEENISQSRSSSDSQSSVVFEDIENYTNKSKETKNDFYNDPIFHSILSRYKNQGIKKSIISIISIVFVLLWIIGVIVYSQLSPKQLLNKTKWQTNIKLFGQNITLNEYNSQFKNITFDNWRNGDYMTYQESITWLTPEQYPSGNSGGYYITPRKDQFLLKQINTDFEDIIINSRKFPYKNNFFHISDIIINPSKSIEELNNNHIIVSDKLAQWRHSTFALYWLYNPILATYTPIQPPNVETNVLEKLHFAEFSPDGNTVAFAFEHNLFVHDVSTGEVHQITNDGSTNIFNGKPDWVYEEEVTANDRMIWWSPDSSKFIFVKLNDTNVQSVDIDYYIKQNTEIGMQYEQSNEKQYKNLNQYPIKTSLKYPKPGTNIPIVSIYTYDVKSKKVESLSDKDKTLGDEFILYQAIWVDNDNFLMKQTDRTSKLFARKVFNGNEVTRIESFNVTGKYGGWVEKMKPINLAANGGYIDNCFENGNNYICLFDKAASAEPKIFNKYPTISEGIYNNQHNCIYFLTSAKSAMDSHLIGVNINTNEYIEYTSLNEDGYYSTKFSKNGQFLSLKYNGPNQPWQRLISMTELHEQEKEHVEHTILEQPIINFMDKSLKNLENTNIPTTTFNEIKLEKEDISISIKTIFPPGFNPEFKYPLLVHAYGGPGSQTVQKQYDLGFLDVASSTLNSIIFVIEPRGTGGKDWKFKSYANNNIGYWEPRDIKLITSEFISANKFIQKNKVAIWGWSYGGFTTLKTLEFDNGEIFKFGVAIAPVTNWLFYDAIYTERYMNKPQDNPSYNVAQISKVENLKNIKNFLIMHGSADDNVHVQNSMWLMDKLNLANIHNYEFHLFPDNDHNINYHNGNSFVYKKMLNWLQNNFSS
ncbi:STE13 [Candida pseudojiufengensis]|uniref:STE13 n=1 Tax=Candida pseudojiufengensis TaxID=497109 RepID=UPI0022252CB9|nr:STE13 [Candida pseudojiufengensis]KAI5962486.1 STE13 [Candida pseudojiufengensis]